jgi:hypothetical protein
MFRRPARISALPSTVIPTIAMLTISPAFRMLPMAMTKFVQNSIGDASQIRRKT